LLLDLFGQIQVIVADDTFNKRWQKRYQAFGANVIGGLPELD
jgi:hypothetical protein